MATNSHRAERTESFAGLEQQILSARRRAGYAVNREMLLLFWQLGREIIARETTESREGHTVDELAVHLRHAFPGSICFAGTNLERMRAFAKAWPDFAAVESVLMQLPWEHHLVLLSKLKTPKQRLAYAQHALKGGWSSATLALRIGRRTNRRVRGRSSAST